MIKKITGTVSCFDFHVNPTVESCSESNWKREIINIIFLFYYNWKREIINIIWNIIYFIII